jgi:hypothetical protein
MNSDDVRSTSAINLPHTAQLALVEAAKSNPYIRALTSALRQARSDEEALISFAQAVLILHGAYSSAENVA